MQHLFLSFNFLISFLFTLTLIFFPQYPYNPFLFPLVPPFPSPSFPSLLSLFPLALPSPFSSALNHHDHLLFLRSNPPRVLFSFLFFTHLDVATHSSTFARATTPTSAPPRPTCSVSSSLFLFSSGSVSSSPYHWFPSFVVRKEE